MNILLMVDGKVCFMIVNVLVVLLVGYFYGFKLEDIWFLLVMFLLGVVQILGCMNIFDFWKFKVLIDFVYNLVGYLGIEDFLNNVEFIYKIGIILGIGDCCDEDIWECGRIVGWMFDYIIICQEKNLWGCIEQEIIDLLFEGMFFFKLEISYEIILKEVEVIVYVIDIVMEGVYVVVFSDVVMNVIGIVQSYFDKVNVENMCVGNVMYLVDEMND